LDGTSAAISVNGQVNGRHAILLEIFRNSFYRCLLSIRFLEN